MLLETLDIKQDDLIIYSQNKFDLNNNFKIIYKDDPKLLPHPVSFSEVCACLSEFTPKTVLVYRLLTNLDDFPISNSKYGFALYINNISEIIYPDPIFALKEMEQYISSSGNYDLRFRIQQVGLTTLTRKNKTANYAEVFSADLTGVEAINQNDKVFVDALLTKGVFKESHEEKDPDAVQMRSKIESRLSEDQSYNSSDLSKMNQPKGGSEPETKTIPPRSFSEFLKRKALKQDDSSREIASPVLEIFYSNEVLENHLEGKKESNVVLKLEPEK